MKIELDENVTIPCTQGRVKINLTLLIVLSAVLGFLLGWGW